MVDHSKFGNVQMFSFAAFDEIDVLVTDTRADPEAAAAAVEPRHRGPSCLIRASCPRPPSSNASQSTAARAAAEIVTAAYGQPRPVGRKSSPTDVVTQTDLRAEERVRGILLEATPAAGILGEEGGTTAPGARLQWVIDPLDGTINFIYGVPLFAVSIAAAIDGEIVAGAVVDVLRGELFSATSRRRRSVRRAADLGFLVLVASRGARHDGLLVSRGAA